MSSFKRFPVVLAIVAVLQLAVARPTAADLVLDRFALYLESLRVQGGIPGLSAVLVGEQGILWEGAFGRRDLAEIGPPTADTPFHFDGLTQLVTASLVLQCVEQGLLTLDAPVGLFEPFSVDANVTVRELLTHSSGTSGTAFYLYQPERLESLRPVIAACTQQPLRETVATLFDLLAMYDSVPGPDAVFQVAQMSEGYPSAATLERYAQVLGRLAMPYSVAAGGGAAPSQYSALTLWPGGGVISTARDFAKFDVALKNGVLITPATRSLMWQAPTGSSLQALPHGVGWFVQSYKGELVAWQFGMTENASSALVITLPARGLTLILLANSDGLVKPFALTNGDVAASPFGRVFLGFFVP